ncbi:thioester reductase domain-containing protein [Frankia sp. CNm7]|uniref:Thioester reductase domain-containing protein n=1 Tax=Frankia nepalensis TaxID=1836974 RepID=A0A937RSP3_9ACTN|nr:carboxylic acid reductase [Frankia nepalensis]MBL7499059.1 thioester reductase domain-containing protein [Frankia nepalensis]MBL7514501.1 thioester reductase domain-containing protein [Frankia nepalensis]MBL7520543.1 thioester reductase domain-containing protein [Frankia nepalensis]MBL7632033.1 thioester reductase domain-containing protein [Frankia nepalensis]
MSVTDVRRPAERLAEMAEADHELRALSPDPEVTAAARRPGLSYQQIIATVLDGYAGRSALGQRRYEVVQDDAGRARRVHQPGFDSITYSELHRRIKYLAAAWRDDPRYRVEPGDFVCILGFASADYVTVDLAVAYQLAVSVPLQATLATTDLRGIIADTAPTAVAAEMTDLHLAATLAGTQASIHTIIALRHDARIDEDRERLAAARDELASNGSRARLVTLDELIAAGRDLPAWEPPPPSAAGADRMALLIHSSGSTGTPKGVIVTEHTAAAQWDPGERPGPVVRVALAPLNHMAGRHMIYSAFAHGGRVNITARSDLSTVFEDIRLTRPTEVSVFPRILDLIYQHFLSEVVRRVAEGAHAASARAEAMRAVRTEFLGDRVCAIGGAGAPVTPQVRQFIEECFQVRLGGGYGSTEAGTMAVMGRVLRPPVTDYRLRDVPELGYFRTDKPYPRGEFCVKSERATPGYFKRPEATAALFDADGYLCTGDIVEERGPDQIEWIGRRNDVLKLAQSEFVAVGALATTFENGSELIDQIFVYGNSARSYVLAVVVPNPDVMRDRLGDNPTETSVRDLIRSELRDIAAKEGLRSFEVPRDFIVEHEPFTHENGLLSSVHKRMRPALEARYRDRLEQLYSDLERRQTENLAALKELDSATSVLDKVVRALEVALGVEDIDPAASLGFIDLGGDSLGAAAFSTTLGDIFGVEVPVNAILSPTGNPQAWTRLIESTLDQSSGRLATFERVHGTRGRLLRAADLDISAFLDADVLRQAPSEPPPATSTCVLLTGATGFLGRFMCLEWLERLDATGGRLICLVRATDEAAAWDRLAAGFGTDPDLRQRFAALSEGRLEVVIGDVAEPRLGLPAAAFDRLARQVDRIVHPGALVNHVLPYEALFGPNVAGTAELVRLALTHRQKRFDFVSSAATTYLLDRGVSRDEDAPLLDEIDLDHYRMGYGASKWAAEQVLLSAHRAVGLPVNVFRGDMMLAHRTYHGQINVPDVFTRLLTSIVLTGLAPASFYPLGDTGAPGCAHYDGLPVDFVAAAIVGISAQSHGGFRNYHALNHHSDDGISLDTFVDWIVDAGYPVERVPDYATWFERFETKIKALPETQRQHSSLTVLGTMSQPRPAEPMVATTRFQAAVRDLPVGPEIPHLTRAFIHKCLDDMTRLGLVSAPPGTAGSTPKLP